MCGPEGSPPRPFAVGLLLSSADGGATDARRAARLNLALDTYKYGYFLLDTVEARAWPHDAYQAAEELAACTHADALIIRGPADLADHERLARIADRHRLLVRPSREGDG